MLFPKTKKEIYKCIVTLDYVYIKRPSVYPKASEHPYTTVYAHEWSS